MNRTCCKLTESCRDELRAVQQALKRIDHAEGKDLDQASLALRDALASLRRARLALGDAATAPTMATCKVIDREGCAPLSATISTLLEMRAAAIGVADGDDAA